MMTERSLMILPWRQLSPMEQLARIDAAQDVLSHLQFQLGCGRLSSWQNGFCQDMVCQLIVSQGKTTFTEKQWRKIQQIMEQGQDDLEPDEYFREATEALEARRRRFEQPESRIGAVP